MRKKAAKPTIGRAIWKIAGGRAQRMYTLVNSSNFYRSLVSSTHDITRLLARWAQGEEHALQELTPLVYREMRRLAAAYLRREKEALTLQPTALVHEAYLRLVD